MLQRFKCWLFTHEWELIEEECTVKFIFPTKKDLVVPYITSWIWKCSRCGKIAPGKKYERHYDSKV